MKFRMDLIGVALIILGILIFAFQGLTYTKQENVAQIGNLQVTAESRQGIYIPPVFGGITIVAGLVLVIAGRRKG